MDVTKPSKFIGFGVMDVTKPYKFIGFGAMDVTKPYKCIGFGAMDVTSNGADTLGGLGVCVRARAVHRRCC